MAKQLLIILSCIFLPLSTWGQIEICDNGIDDDFDNLIDLNDDDCICEVIEPISVIPNPSFEEMNCCPDNRSQLNCASLWIQASEPTTDFIHTCDWMGWDQFPPPLPFPDGQGIMGFRDGRVRNGNPEPFWKEYAGACLLSPLLADSTYRFQFDVGFVNPQKSPPIDISIFGTNNCDFLPFGIGDPTFGCPANSPNWDKLGEVTVSGGAGDVWVNTFIEITPDEDIEAIAIGPDCNPISSPISIYYFFDNLLLTDIKSFDLQIKENLHPCNPDFTLSIPNNPDFEYQWYLSGVALEGEVFAELTQNYGEGIYQVRILDGVSCRVSAAYEYLLPVFESTPDVNICQGDEYQFGDAMLTESGSYLDTLVSYNGCDSIVALELNVIGESYDSVEISIFEGQSFEFAGQSFSEAGDYPLTFASSLGCDSLIVLNLAHFGVYIPNVFSPNFDGINDTFFPIAPADQVVSTNIQVFNRWGGLVYEGAEWDGINEQPGVYVYVVIMEFVEGTPEVFYGSVTLLR